jgi:5-oxoprolinase (ATP-hydrolysing) subunit C
MAQVRLLKLGPGVSLQDAGRAGFLAQGLSRGGAADMLALAEGAALLGQGCDCAALEIAGSFLTLEVSAPTRIALTGAPMQARTGETALAWHASHLLPAGARLDLSASAGGYSYVHLGGGVAAQAVLGARSAHMAAGLGPFLTEGETLALGQDSGTRTGLALPPLPRFNGGLLRLVETPQTGLFPPSERARFCATTFRKDHRANRLGQRLDVEGPGFEQRAGLNILSEIITPGDIQITGDGTPFVLLSECQTTGGYPRIGTVLPCDLPRLVQAPPGAALSFAFVTLPEAVALERAEAARRAKLGASLHPLIRDPHHIPDLMRYQLISGVTRGDDLEQERA